MGNMKNFRGFRVKPDDCGTTYFISSEDKSFEGSTSRFEFNVVAKDLDEANRFCRHALGYIPYKLEEIIYKKINNPSEE
jgi:hypothetical protein